MPPIATRRRWRYRPAEIWGSPVRAFIAFVAIVLTTASAVGQTADQRLTGSLTGRSARAAFDLQLEAGQIVTLTTSSSESLDTVLTLNGPADGASLKTTTSNLAWCLRASFMWRASERDVQGRRNRVLGRHWSRLNWMWRMAWMSGVGCGAHVARRDLSFGRRRTEARLRVDLGADDIFVASTFALTDGLDTTLGCLTPRRYPGAKRRIAATDNLNSQIIYQAEPRALEIVAAHMAALASAISCCRSRSIRTRSRHSIRVGRRDGDRAPRGRNQRCAAVA